MKKLILGLFVFSFLVTLAYAETDTNLKEEIATTVNAEIETQVATENSNKILQEYIDFCGGNEKLGKIIYDKRNGRGLRANALGQYIIWTNEKYKLVLTGFLPFAKTKRINNYYPDGIWRISREGEGLDFIPGPLIGILTAKITDVKVLGTVFRYTIYNEQGKEVITLIMSYLDIIDTINYNDVLKAIPTPCFPFDNENDALEALEQLRNE